MQFQADIHDDLDRERETIIDRMDTEEAHPHALFPQRMHYKAIIVSRAATHCSRLDAIRRAWSRMKSGRRRRWLHACPSSCCGFAS